MSYYERQTIFESLDGQALAGATLDDEFNAIQAAIEVVAALLDAGTDDAVLVYDASDPQFAPLGTESHAQRVQAAITAANGGAARTKVVYVPKAYWGYVATTGYSGAIFNANVMMVREGALGPWYDPVAYGADVSGVADSQVAIDYAFLHADTGPHGPQAVAFTVPGTYKKGSNVDRRGCAMLQFPGVSHTGGGSFTGTVAWILDGNWQVTAGLAADRPAAPERAGIAYFSTDTDVLEVWDGAAWVTINPSTVAAEAFTYNADASVGSRAAEVAYVRHCIIAVTGTTNGSGELAVDLDEAQFGGLYNLSDLIAAHATVLKSTGTDWVIKSIDTSGNVITVDTDANSTSLTIYLTLYFSA